jgi:hypothetical protein
MGNLGSLDLKSFGGEARLRALLEDLVQYYVGVYPQHPLALAVWFDKSVDKSRSKSVGPFFRQFKIRDKRSPPGVLAMEDWCGRASIFGNSLVVGGALH